MIALGLGEHQWSLDRCMESYETLSRDGLDSRLATKWWGIGWVARMFRDSIYAPEALETALQKAFGTEHEMYSLKTINAPSNTKHLPRVAVTTTVDEELKVFTNYDMGGTDDYLGSRSLTWQM